MTAPKRGTAIADFIRDAVRGAASDPAVAKAERKADALAAQLADTQAELKAALHLATEERKRAQILASLGEYGRTVKIKRRRKSDKREEGVLITNASDWHGEERVNPKTVNDRNEYDPDIFAFRAENFFSGSEWMANLIRSGEYGYDLAQLVLWLGGDLISGYIHEELQESNFMSPTRACLLVMEQVRRGIDYLLAEGGFERIVIPCNHGNHGRTTAKPRFSTSAENSYEWLMYHMLAQSYRGDDRVEFTIADGRLLYLDVLGWMIRFHHGDDVKYRGGVGGLSIPLRKAVDAWNQERHADVTVVGHFHQSGNPFPDIVHNGSLIGWNAYASANKCRWEPPQQTAFIVDKKRGPRFFTPIRVDERWSRRVAA